MNANANSVDGLIGGALALTLTAAATTTLTLPAGFTPSPGAGPVQSQNAIIKLSGTLSGNNTIVCTRPGAYVVYNNCVVGGFTVVMSNGSGNQVGLPPGALWHVFNDGSNYYHCNLPQVGELVHLAGSRNPPAWIGASTLPPYLLCDGSVYNVSAYPNLGVQLGSTFGGNGATTFGVPNLQGRYPLHHDPTGTVVTFAGSGISADSLGAFGGSQFMQAHTHAFTGTQTTYGLVQLDIWHAGSSGGQLGSGTGGTGNTQPLNAIQTNPSVIITPFGANATTGSGAYQNMPPLQVTGIWMVRAA